MLIILGFCNMENKDSLYRGNDCMKKVCAYLKEYATNVIKFEKKKMLPLTKKKLKLHQNATEYYICGKRFIEKFANSKNYQNYQNVSDHCHFTSKCRGAAHSICNLIFNVPNEIPAVF